MPKRSAAAPNSASAPCAPPLKRMTSSRFTGGLFLVLFGVLVVDAGVGRAGIGRVGLGRIHFRIVVLHEIRRDVDGVVILSAIEVVHAARELRRDGAARLVFLLLKRLLLVFRRRRRTKVALTRSAGGRRTTEA